VTVAPRPDSGQPRIYERPGAAVQPPTGRDLGSELNPEQAAAATFGTGPLLIIAGAGTGKTRTLVYRVAHLLNEGVPPDRILLLTFTRRALLQAAEAPRALFFDDPRAGAKFFGAYGATKAAQIALAQSWAAETATSKLRVRILTPAPMPTATRARFFPGEDRSPLADPRTEAARLLAEALA
jgi:NAD(P)-dependent dehydrogenase (short-subunit alcohol dehydrogenase family)